MTMLTSSLVSAWLYFCSGLQVCIRLFTFSSQDHCNLLYSDHSNNWVSISIFGVRISIQYFCLNFSIKYWWISILGGTDVYLELWTPSVGEVLSLKDNNHDNHCVAVMKGGRPCFQTSQQCLLPLSGQRWPQGVLWSYRKPSKPRSQCGSGNPLHLSLQLL